MKDEVLTCKMIEKYASPDGSVVELFNVHGTLFKRIVSGGEIVSTVSIYDYLMQAKGVGLSDVERKIILIKYNDLCGWNDTYVWVRDKIAEELGLEIKGIHIRDLVVQYYDDRHE